jgi:hypothetical protein
VFIHGVCYTQEVDVAHELTKLLANTYHGSLSLFLWLHRGASGASSHQLATRNIEVNPITALSKTLFHVVIKLHLG